MCDDDLLEPCPGADLGFLERGSICIKVWGSFC